MPLAIQTNYFSTKEYASTYCEGYLPSRYLTYQKKDSQIKARPYNLGLMLKDQHQVDPSGYKLQSILIRNQKNNNKIAYPIKTSTNTFPHFSQDNSINRIKFNNEKKIKISKLVNINKLFLSQILKKVKYHRRYLTT
jgi:hypothetical protein